MRLYYLNPVITFSKILSADSDSKINAHIKKKRMTLSRKILMTKNQLKMILKIMITSLTMKMSIVRAKNLENKKINQRRDFSTLNS
jgi:hypothetical protein